MAEQHGLAGIPALGHYSRSRLPRSIPVMAGYEVLSACAHSIVDMLNRGLTTTALGAAAPPTLLIQPEQVRDRTRPTPCVAVLAHRLSSVPTARTRPGRDPNQPTPLAMSLHFAVCCFGATVEDELRWTGLAARLLAQQPILTGKLLLPAPLPDGTTVNPWSPGDRVQIVVDDQGGDSGRAALPGLEARPHLRYLATGLHIDMS